MGSFSLSGGVEVLGFISPTDSLDTYAVIDPLYGIDGFRNVNSISDLNNIPEPRRRAGMVVGVSGGTQYYKLLQSPWTYTISDWGIFNTGGSNSGTTQSFTGGTVTGSTVFTNGLSATTISATTYQNLPLDVYVTGLTFNVSNYDLTINRNDGVSFTDSLSILASDLTVTGGTYDPNSGVATFTNNTGGTFNVSGFITGFTDIYTTGITYSNNEITISDTSNNTYSTFIDNFTGLTINGVLSATTIGTSGDCVDDIYVSNIHSCSPLNINPLDEGNVYFGSTSGVTFDLLNNKVGIGTSTPSTIFQVVGSYTGGTDALIPQMLFQNSNTVPNTNKTAIIRTTVGSGYVAGGYPEIWLESQETSTGVGLTKLRTVSNHPLLFYTNDIERGRFGHTGNFGLNTQSPAGILHVRTGLNKNIIFTSGATRNLIRSLIDGNSDYVGLEIDTLDLNIKTNGVDRVIINSSGDTGIGTITPTAKLHINNTTSGNTFLAEDSTNPDSSPFVIDASGNTGIGIVTPTVKLHLSGNSIFEQSKLTINQKDGIVGIDIVNSGESMYQLSNSITDWCIVGKTPSEFYFYNSLNVPIRFYTNASEKMTVLGNGNVGIGITSPTAKLHINNTTSGNTFLAEDDTNPDSSPFVIDASGNTGIGTLTPTVKLQVSGKTVISSTLSGSSFERALSITNTSGEIFYVRGYGDALLANSLYLGVQNGNNSIGPGNLRIQSGVGVGVPFVQFNHNNGTTAFRILSNTNLELQPSAGNVLIGTTNDLGYKLNVNGSTNIGGDLVVSGITGTTWFSGNSSSDLVRITQTGSGNAFVVEDNTNPDSSPFVIDASGNTGIGTLTPTVKLDVSGNTRLVGALQLGNLTSNNSGNTLTIGHNGSTTSSNDGTATVRFASQFVGIYPFTMGAEGNGYNFYIRQNNQGQGTFGFDFNTISSVSYLKNYTYRTSGANRYSEIFTGPWEMDLNNGSTTNRFVTSNSFLNLSLSGITEGYTIQKNYTSGYPISNEPIVSFFNGSVYSSGSTVNRNVARINRLGYLGIGTSLSYSTPSTEQQAAITIDQTTFTGVSTTSPSVLAQIRTIGTNTTCQFLNSNPNNVIPFGLIVGSKITANGVTRTVTQITNPQTLVVDSAVNWDNGGLGYNFTFKNPYISLQDGSQKYFVVDSDGNTRLQGLTATTISASTISAPGSTTQVIYNNGGVLSADTGFVYSGGNVGIGTTTPTAKLQVRVNDFNAANGGFVVTDSGNTESYFTVSNVGQVGIRTPYTGSNFQFAITNTNPSFSNAQVRFNVSGDYAFSMLDNQGYGFISNPNAININTRSTQGNINLWTQAGDTTRLNLGGQDINPTIARTRTIIKPVNSNLVAFTPSAGTAIDYSFENGGTAVFQPTGGTASYTQIQLRPTYNTTGSYSGTVRGLYYNPILTSLSGTTHRAIETTTGDVLFGTTSGNVGIGTTTPSQKLDVSGNISVTGCVIPNLQIISSSASVTPTYGNDLVAITGLSTNVTINNPTGTWPEGKDLTIRIKDDGVARTITWDTKYRAIGVTLPNTTIASKTTYIGLIYNSIDDKFDVIGSTTEL